MKGTLVIAAMTVLSCRSPTQVTFEVTTDIACGEHQGTELTVGPLSEVDRRPVSSSRAACDPATGRIGTVVVVPSGDDDEEIAARFVLGIGKTPQKCVEDGFTGGCIVARRALRFIPHEPLVVAVPMRSQCRDVTCPSGQTCVRGGCVGATITDPGSCVGDGCGEDSIASPPTDAGLPDTAVSDTGFSGKRVFVSSTTYTAALGGPAGADAKCQAVAVAAKLPGTFAAWISDKTSTPALRFSKIGPYKLVDGTLIANDWKQLTSGTLLHAIDLTETSGPPPTGSGSFCSTQPLGAWSGTTPAGDFSTQDSCQGFTNGSGTFTSRVQYGDPKAVNSNWTYGECLNAGVTYCAKRAALYCFEQ